MIDEAEAMEILSKPGVNEELARLERLVSKQEAGLSSIIGSSNAESVVDADPEQGLNKRMKALLQRISEEGVSTLLIACELLRMTLQVKMLSI